MGEKDIVKDAVELKRTSTRNGFSGKEKEDELPPAILPSYDDAVSDAGLDGITPSKSNGKSRWVPLS